MNMWVNTLEPKIESPIFWKSLHARSASEGGSRVGGAADRQVRGAASIKNQAPEALRLPALF